MVIAIAAIAVSALFALYGFSGMFLRAYYIFAFAAEEDMSFAWFVPPFSIYVLWRNRAALVSEARRGSFSWIGLAASLPFLCLALLGTRGVQLRLELYTKEELARIVTRSAALLGIEIDPQGALEIASRSRGTPRIANRMLRRVRDFADIYHDSVITREAADHALAQLEVDKLGLDAIDRRMLTAIIRNYGGGPVGLETLAATIGEEAVTLEDVYEPYLMQIGFLSRTPRGRCVTQLAYDHLHLENPNAPQEQQLSF